MRRLRRTSTAVSPKWARRFRRLAERMGGRPSVRLRRSDRIEGPVVAGWWRPVVLVPAGLLAGLPPKQVEALLLHELAHIRRHDVLVGRLQAVVEGLFFFHPATWWISRQVRQAREACCDDLAVQGGGAERAVVARALAALAERAVGARGRSWVPAAADGSLLHRIRRLLSPERAPSGRTQRLSVGAAVVLVVGLPLGLVACASQQSTTEAEPPAASGESRAEVESDVEGIRTDSSERMIRFGTGGPVEADTLRDGIYDLRYDGPRTRSTVRGWGTCLN